MISLLIQYIHKRNGATALEYGLIAAGIALAVAAAIFFLGDTLSGLFYNELPEVIDGASS